MAAFDFNDIDAPGGVSAPQLAVAVVEPVPGIRLDLEDRLGPGVSGFENIDTILSKLSGAPTVVVLGPSLDSPSGVLLPTDDSAPSAS